MPNSLPVLKIGKHTPRYPLIQGGMGVRISGPSLAGAVARAGGIGTIASVGLAVASEIFNGKNYFEANQIVLKEDIATARKAAEGGVLAVNAMVAITDYDLHVKAACEGGADIIISGAGLPLKLPELTKDFPDVALVPIVSSTKAADLIVRRWDKLYGRLPDAFVVETPLYAGGHLGVTKMEQVMDEALSLETVVPELVRYIEDEVKTDIPVIGAGGIWDRHDMEKIFALGAKGVQMGTRFAATVEGDADIRFKQALIDATDDDVVIIKSPVGIPGRALRSPFVRKYLDGTVESKPCFANCLSHCSYRTDKKAFCIAQALVDAYRGDWEEGLFFCGSNVSRIDGMETVDGIFEELFG
ncbi:MAG: nitronate monooxygenase family protein [Thermovirga sp.]